MPESANREEERDEADARKKLLMGFGSILILMIISFRIVLQKIVRNPGNRALHSVESHSVDPGDQRLEGQRRLFRQQGPPNDSRGGETARKEDAQKRFNAAWDRIDKVLAD